MEIGNRLPKRLTATGLAMSALTLAACGDQESANPETASANTTTQTTTASPTTTPSTTVPLPAMSRPQAYNTVEEISSLREGQLVHEEGIRIRRYKTEGKYAYLSLWGLVQYCNLEGALIQENVSQQPSSYKDGQVTRTATRIVIQRDIFSRHSVCRDKRVDPNELTPKTKTPSQQV